MSVCNTSEYKTNSEVNSQSLSGWTTNHFIHYLTFLLVSCNLL